MRGDDILSVIFLVFVCLVIMGLAKHIAPNMVMPSFVVLAVGLWIVYDFMLVKRYKSKEKCLKKSLMRRMHKESPLVHIPRTLTEDEESVLDKSGGLKNIRIDYVKNLGDDNDNINEGTGIDLKTPKKKYSDVSLTRQSSNEDDFEVIDVPNSDGQIADRMKYMAIQPQQSILARANFGSHSAKHIFDEEFEEDENLVWWENVDQMEHQSL